MGSDAVAIEPVGLVWVETERVVFAQFPVSQYRVHYRDSPMDLFTRLPVDLFDRTVEHLDALVAQLHDLLFGGLLAENIARELIKVIPHHEWCFTRDAIVLVLDCHESDPRLNMFDDLIRVGGCTSLIDGEENVG